MQDRIIRFRETALGSALIGVELNGSYQLEISQQLLDKIGNGYFDRVLFVGYGCSSAPIEVIRAYLNDVDVTFPIIGVSAHNFNDPYYRALITSRTLVFVSSFSGNTKECLLAFKYLAQYCPKNLVAITGGGELYELAQERVRWTIKGMDREYPIFHLPQIVVALLNLFQEIGIIPKKFCGEESKVVLDQDLENAGITLGRQARDCPITLISPYQSAFLAKVMSIYFSEIAMVHSTVIDIHEFSHVNIAACTKQIAPQVFVLFRDDSADKHTIGRYQVLADCLADHQCKLLEIQIPKSRFFHKFINGMTLCNWMVYELAKHYDIPDANIITRMVKNTTYAAKI